jgi:hypothetical protein
MDARKAALRGEGNMGNVGPDISREEMRRQYAEALAVITTLRARLAKVEQALTWILRSDLVRLPVGLRQLAYDALGSAAAREE